MRERAAGVVVWILPVCALVGLTLDHAHPYQGDETYYIKSAVWMTESGNWLLPQYEGVVRLQKPILAYWMTALGYRAFGTSLWAGRVPFLLAAGALLFVVYRLGRLLSGSREAASVAVALLSSSLLFLLFSRVSMTDLPLALCSTVSLYFLCRAVGPTGRGQRDAALAHLAMGAGFLAKGATALMPLAAVAAWLVVSRCGQARAALRAILAPGALAAFALVAMPWHIYVWVVHRGVWLSQFAREASENLGPGVLASAGHLAYYAGAMVAYQWPAAALGAWAWWRLRAGERGSRACDGCARNLAPLMWYAGLSLVVFVFAFAFAHHRDRYLLAIVPALSVVLARVIHHAGIARPARKLAAAAAIVQIAAVWVHGQIVGHPLHELVARWEQQARGDLAVHAVPRREAAWTLAIAGGRLVPYRDEVPYVMTTVATDGSLSGRPILHRAFLTQSLARESGRLVVKKQAILLLGPRPPLPPR